MSDNRDQYNHGGMLAFLGSMIFVFLFFIYIVAIHPGVDLNENVRTPPSKADAEAAKLANADADVSKITEPWKPNADMVKHGHHVFEQTCSMCHGPEGHGDGAAGAALNPKPRNLVEGPWKKGGGYIGWMTVINEGIAGSGMASWKALPLQDRWALVQFIDSITKAKVKEDPAKVEAFAKTVK
jgi:mono/diheme cytochrome c family protein